MSRLQRSSVSFRRQGSSGRIWDDPLRGLDLKGLATPRAAPGAVAPLLHHPDASSILAGGPSPRVVSRSLMRHDGCGAFGGGGGAGNASSSAAGVIVESPDVAAAAGPVSPATVVVGADGERHERPARRRRRISSAFCACMGHPPASHAQQ
ncbi:hypothetical protein BAE44_0015547 [Dichanthelium oligosanthes]|uniref:Uncharacterized protein n=1 Tax=Dichanthelium oligosanthes TaxID=888268 RepID=A0A1E5VEJ6_9POAL|nr:hypothetical protein BAE44_0015547 [Dichanthelium oligosanthes]